MGFFTDLLAGAPNILAVPKGREYYDRIQAGKGVGVAYEIVKLFANDEFPEDLTYWPDTK